VSSPSTPQPQLPRCPYCSTQPMPVVTAFINILAAKAAVFMCGLCSAAINVQLLGVAQQTESRVVVPGVTQ